ncbi:MAG: transcriptional repressor LexA [Xanthomonadales bacterium]|nr:transcriptional repressor LexA [Xanthomonadales bacterium]
MQLTDRQQAILDFLTAFQAGHGYPPTRAEIARAFGFSQARSAEDHLRALAAKGAIALEGGRSRGIRVLAGAGAGEEGDAGAPPAAADLLSLPLVGRVAAGAPILSDAHIAGRYALDRALFRPRPHFLLRVEGDSMREAGILDGDLIAVHRTPVAESGQIVVARLDDEITVKRLRRGADGGLALLPANPDYAPIPVDPARQAFAIEGLHVGVIRRG